MTLAGLTRVEATFPINREILVELDENTLEQTGISLSRIAEKIRKNIRDLSGGTLYMPRWDTGLRTNGQKRTASQLETLPVKQGKDGNMVYLSDIAHVREAPGNTDIECWFNGHPAVVLDIFAVNGQSPGEVAQIVKQFIRQTIATKYNGVGVQIFENQADAYHSRMTLLVETPSQALSWCLGYYGFSWHPGWRSGWLPVFPRPFSAD